MCSYVIHMYNVSYYKCIQLNISNYIKTHDSESQGQEEAAIICETKIT